jgi:class 3 adenylate cyclase/tetratricopeptide (TPR) repeat protein
MHGTCPACNADLPLGARFCAQCGERLADTAARTRGAPESGDRGGFEPESAERRQLTVIFCDLVGSTELTAQLGPEEWSEVVRAYHGLCADVVGRFGGHVAQYLGDGVLIYFGYPHALEDGAQRAVRTGLHLVEEVASARFGRQLKQPLEVRVGIHTGMVVIGDSVRPGGRREDLAYGDTLNVAARIQSLATPGSVVLGSSTRRLVQDYFDLEPLGPQKLKGVAEPIDVYRVSGQSGLETRFDVALKTGLVPQVGREEDLAFLLQRWESVKSGSGQVVCISGEPGIGKSRLLAEAAATLASDAPTEIDCRCSSDRQNSALHPLIEYLERLLDFGREDSAETKLEKLAAGIEPYRGRPPETLPLFAELLSLPHPEGAPQLDLAPGARKQRMLDALLGWLVDTAERQPVWLVLEDLHWADPSTIELFGHLIERAASARICVLITTRNRSLLAPWEVHPHLHHIELQRLASRDVSHLVQEVTGGKPLPAEIVEQIVQKTDGVPLFVEELTKMVLDADWLREGEDAFETTGPLPTLAIPTTLQDSLMARLDQLPAARGVAQLGATLGRGFPHALIRAVNPSSDEVLAEGLEALERAELLYHETSAGETYYVFKHALVQDAAYESLLKSNRQRYHAWTAEVLEKDFVEETETRPEIVAQHYTEAGLVERALPHWQRAGERALMRSAHIEAVNHLERALSLLPELPDPEKNDVIELGLRQTLGVALVVSRGYPSEAVQRNYSRAEELCASLGNAPELLPTLYGLWSYHMLRNQRDATFALANRVGKLEAFPEQRFVAASMQGVSLYWSGAFKESEVWLGRAVELYDPAYHATLDPILGDEAALLSPLQRAWALLELGRFDAAKQAMAYAGELVGPRPAPYLRTTWLVFQAMLHLRLRDASAVRSVCEELVPFATEQHFPHFLGSALRAQGAAMIWDGAPEAGLERLNQGIAIMDAVGELATQSFWLARHAEGYAATGNTADGLATIEKAIAAEQGTLVQAFAADVQNVKGELLRPTDPDAAEQCFREAIRIAREKASLAQELRATLSLATGLDERQRSDEAYEILTRSCEAFDEGFDTPDLLAAKQMLARLSQKASSAGARS